MITGKKVIFYTRVSTDEQKEHGFSLQEQLVQLKRYCKSNNNQFIGHFQDDCSAKSFDRPEYKRLLNLIEKKEIAVDCILVTKSDRFSRNTKATMDMISHLVKHSIKV
ncbi:MAG: recombinase family protein, partial [Bacteroidota bacterium]